MAFEHLKVKPLQRATSWWANSVVDALNMLYGAWEQVYKRGTLEEPWDYFYGIYGYFEGNLFVQGKPVIKDGDPINVYDIQDPAREKIAQAIDQSLLAQYVKETRDVVVKLNIDVYGRVGVIISEPIDTYGNIKVSPRDIEEDLLPASGIIDTATETSPKIIVAPPAGKRVDVRRCFVSTNSTSGKVYVKFQNSGRIITSIYPTKYGHVVLPAIRILGDPDDPVIVEWSGLDTGAEITYMLNYKII